MRLPILFANAVMPLAPTEVLDHGGDVDASSRLTQRKACSQAY
jgi:hypothetical protein